MLLCPAPSPPVLLRHLPSPRSSIISFPLAHVSASALTLSRHHIRSSMQTERDGSVGGSSTQTGQLQDGASSLSHLVPPSASSFPYPSISPPATPVSAGEACINLLRHSPPLVYTLDGGKKEKEKRAQQSGKSHQEVVRCCLVGAVNPAHIILSFAVKGKSRRNSISANWCNNSLPHVLKVQSQSAQALFPHGHFYIFYNLRLMLSRQTV